MWRRWGSVPPLCTPAVFYLWRFSLHKSTIFQLLGLEKGMWFIGQKKEQKMVNSDVMRTNISIMKRKFSKSNITSKETRMTWISFLKCKIALVFHKNVRVRILCRLYTSISISSYLNLPEARLSRKTILDLRRRNLSSEDHDMKIALRNLATLIRQRKPHNYSG